MADRPGPQPWPGCDTAGGAWRAYCEAWEFIYSPRKPSNWQWRIEQHRGREGVAAINHNISVVRRDYGGELADRSELPRLLRL